MAYLFPVTKNTERISKYKEYIDKVNYNGIKFLVKLQDILKIENINDIKFNVFCVSEQKSEVFPRYISKKICDKTCNLLLIEENDKSHYVWIKIF